MRTMFSQPEILQEILVILNAITGHLEVQDLHCMTYQRRLQSLLHLLEYLRWRYHSQIPMDWKTVILRYLEICRHSLKLSSFSLSRLIYWFRFQLNACQLGDPYCNIIFWRQTKLVNKTNNQWKLEPLYCYCLVVSIFLDPKYATCIYHLSL